MKRRVSIVMTILFLTADARPALANAGVDLDPNIIFLVWLILPVTMLLTLAGGGYAVLQRLSGGRRGLWRPLPGLVAGLGVIIIPPLLFLLATPVFGEFFVLVIGVVFGGIALHRSFRLVHWGWLAHKGHAAPAYLATARPWRLHAAGGLLLVVTILLTGWAIALSLDYPRMGPSRETGVGALMMHIVAYHLDGARDEEVKTGQKKYPQLRPIRRQSLSEGDRNFISEGETLSTYEYAGKGWEQTVLGMIRIEYAPNEQGFTIYWLPHEVPLFPFNFLFPEPSFRADQTGQLRMCHVRMRGALCPPDAPILLRLAESETKEILARGGLNRRHELREYFLKKREEEARRKEREKGPA